MNVSDSEIVHSILSEAGYHRTFDVEDADILLANTCAIRENPEQKVHHRINYFNSVKKKRSKLKKLTVGVLGCMAERLKSKLLDDGKVDIVAGPDAYRSLPDLIEAVHVDPAATAINTQLSFDETYADITPTRHSSNSHSAFISIMRGCNNMCTYCIVPFTRGRERSRKFNTIVDEVKRLRDEGVKEITLLGQNVNSYHDKSEEALTRWPECSFSTAKGFNNLYRSRKGAGARFSDLLNEVAEVDPEIRIRFTSPHPKDFPDQVLEAIASRPNVCKSIHLPAQSGSSAVLQTMRRGHTREAYLELVSRARGLIPNLEISSDFISGFCGETEEDHRQTLSLIEEVQFSQAFMYAYSLRDRTHAHYNLKDNVPSDVKLRRLQEVIATFHKSALKLNQEKEIGRLHLVLVEGYSKKSMENKEFLTGRTDTNKRVVFKNSFVPWEMNLVTDSHIPLQKGKEKDLVRLVNGDYAIVRIEEVTGHTLKGIPIARSTNLDFYNKTSGNMILEMHS